MNTKIKLLIMMFVTALLLSLVFAPASHAALNQVGPANPVDGFPTWYQDSNGLTLGQCLDTASGNCIVLPDDFYDGVNPIVFPLNYPGEAFYWIADTLFGPFRYRAALEAAFATANPIGAPVAGQQSVFARIRVRGHVPVVGTYVFTHPYGTQNFVVTALTPAGAPEINFTEDVPLGIPLDFAGALGGAIGPFLQASATSGGAPSPFIVDAATGARYLANPAAFVNVTGGPNGNVVSVVGPASNDSTPLFNLAGKIIGLTASPAAVTFTPQRPDVTSALTITVTNPGTVAATLGAGAITGANLADFTLGPDACSGATVAANGTCSVTVNFSEAAPGVNGPKSAVLSIPITAPVNMPPLIVNLAGAIDNVAPTVVTTLPADGAVNWPANNRPHVTFSEPVIGVTSTTFTIAGPGGVDVGGTVSLQGGGTILDYALPAAGLDPNSVTYTATLTAGITDLVGNPLAAKTFTFTTGAADTTPPSVKSTTPLNNATGVRVADPIIATFAGSVDPGDVTSTTFFLSDGVAGTVTYDIASQTAILKPDKPLEFFHQYTATVKGGANGVTSLGQVPMTGDFTWTFFTNGAPNAPVLYLPADKATGVTQPIDFQWVKSEDQDGGTVTYQLWYCTNPAMLGCTPVDVAGTSTAAASSLRNALAGLGGYGAGMLLAGFAIMGGVKFKKKIFIFIAVLAISGMVATACTKTNTETVTPTPDPATLVTKSVSGLQAGTTYYWKVVADDGNGALINSETRSFKTQ